MLRLGPGGKCPLERENSRPSPQGSKRQPKPIAAKSAEVA